MKPGTIQAPRQSTSPGAAPRSAPTSTIRPWSMVSTPSRATPSGSTRWPPRSRIIGLGVVAGARLERFGLERRDQRGPLLDQPLEGAPVVGVADGVFGKEREGDGRIAIGDAGI